MTAGNDQWHHNNSPNSNHTKGWKIDFTYEASDKEEYPNTNENTQYIYEVLLFLGQGTKPTKSLWEKYGYTFRNPTGNPDNTDFSAISFHEKYPFKVKDEYNNPASVANGPHFDIEFKNQTEQWSKSQEKIIPKS